MQRPCEASAGITPTSAKECSAAAAAIERSTNLELDYRQQVPLSAQYLALAYDAPVPG